MPITNIFVESILIFVKNMPLVKNYPATVVFVLKMWSAFMSAAWRIKVHFKLDFITEANTMYPDKIAPKPISESCSPIYNIF